MTMNINTITVDDLIFNLLTNEPKQENEIQLQFINDISIKELFEFCMEFFNELCKYKYGDANGKVDISTWNESTINHIKAYYKSFGMNINILFLEPTRQNYNTIKFYESREYKKYPITHNTKLQDLYYVMFHQSTNKYYIINFNFNR